ncbi:hypothetical protein EVAR_67854_1 [Eumeta japonica]|uniref:Uncharacterized protein n=1 Tax=Eumeta variegata TaxID=151549 RepID=A0A4C1SHY8_EUMVA|nr:hypothetical protein EVAR_67854_1 [Eumeta japonica]
MDRENDLSFSRSIATNISLATGGSHRSLSTDLSPSPTKEPYVVFLRQCSQCKRVGGGPRATSSRPKNTMALKIYIQVSNSRIEFTGRGADEGCFGMPSGLPLYNLSRYIKKT